jgi:hypothetical protein
MELHEDVPVVESRHDDDVENENEDARAVGFEDNVKGISKSDDGRESERGRCLGGDLDLRYLAQRGLRYLEMDRLSMTGDGGTYYQERGWMSRWWPCLERSEDLRGRGEGCDEAGTAC